MELETHRLASTTGILAEKVEDLQDFVSDPDKYLVDLYNDDVAEEAWLRTGARHHFTYNEGVVTLIWQGTPLLGVPTWDDICGIWSYLVAVVEGYLSTGRGESSFPDQPIQIVLERIHGGALISIGEVEDTVAWSFKDLRLGSARLVDAGSMFDAMNVQDVLFNIEREQHAVVAPACCAQSQEFIRQRLAEPVRIVGQSSSDEFDDRGGSFLGQLAEALQRGTGDFDFP